MIRWTLPGLVGTAGPEEQVAPLLAIGITLGHTDQPPVVKEQQALVLAGGYEAAAAAKAKNTSARYVLLNYPGAHVNLKNVPAWMVWYQRIPLEATDASVDPTPFPRSTHDLYVFLDANTGKELLSIWI